MHSDLGVWVSSFSQESRLCWTPFPCHVLKTSESRTVVAVRQDAPKEDYVLSLEHCGMKDDECKFSATVFV